ncbi:MAG TPA: glycoside hydrolase family 31 protein, partial [bacterium]|nr:glycoside hydrolase family 31 protein [bacterium]
MREKMKKVENAGKVIKYRRTPCGVDLTLEKGTAAIKICSPEIIRVRVWEKEPETDFSWAVVMKQPKKSDFKLTSDDHDLTIETSVLKAVVHKNPFKMTFFDKSQRKLSEDAIGAGWKGGAVICEKNAVPSERFYGFGEKTFPIDRRGSKMVMWNTDNPFCKPGGDPLYVTIPFYIGLHSGAAYGVFFDSPWKSWFDVCASGAKKTLGYKAAGGDLNYYFMAGPDVKGVVSNFTRLTGRMNLPPRWSIGNHQSRWSYKTEKRVRSIAKGFADNNIPLDAVHLDIHYMDNYKVFTWNNSRFPEPKQLMDSFSKEGLGVITIIDPGVKIEKGYELYEEGLENDYFCRRADRRYFRGVVWPGDTVFPDFARKDVRDWWAGHIAAFTAENNVAGIWNDMNDPSVNI